MSKHLKTDITGIPHRSLDSYSDSTSYPNPTRQTMGAHTARGSSTSYSTPTGHTMGAHTARGSSTSYSTPTGQTMGAHTARGSSTSYSTPTGHTMGAHTARGHTSRSYSTPTEGHTMGAHTARGHTSRSYSTPTEGHTMGAHTARGPSTSYSGHTMGANTDRRSLTSSSSQYARSTGYSHPQEQKVGFLGVHVTISFVAQSGLRSSHIKPVASNLGFPSSFSSCTVRKSLLYIVQSKASLHVPLTRYMCIWTPLYLEADHICGILHYCNKRIHFLSSPRQLWCFLFLVITVSPSQLVGKGMVALTQRISGTRNQLLRRYICVSLQLSTQQILQWSSPVEWVSSKVYAAEGTHAHVVPPLNFECYCFLPRIASCSMC